MRHSTLKALVMAGAAISLAACKDGVAPLISDAQMASNVAASAGDAAANQVKYMFSNDSAVAMPSSQPPAGLSSSPPISETVTITRTRTGFDVNGVEVTNCSPISSVRKVATHFTVDGTRQGTYFTGTVHRVADDTTTRNFTQATEVSRTHNGVATAHDVTNFADATTSATHTEDATDSINAVTFNLPRSSNPWPVSGSFVRHVSVHAEYTKNGTTVIRDFTKRVEVDFPADAQGNVVLKIDALTCNLNLVTHVVSGCH